VRYIVGLLCAVALLLSAAIPAKAQDANGCTAQYISAGNFKITVKKDGGPCSALQSTRRGSWQSGSITAPPQHGTASVTINGAQAVFVYTPAKGYVGPDVFRAEIAASRPFPQRIDIVVTP